MANFGRTPLNVKRKVVIGFSSIMLVAGLAVSVLSLAQDDEWVLPRTEYGHPDLQGNWTNGTMTPVQRPEGLGKVLTPEQIASMEGKRDDLIKAVLEAARVHIEHGGRNDWREFTIEVAEP